VNLHFHNTSFSYCSSSPVEKLIGGRQSPAKGSRAPTTCQRLPPKGCPTSTTIVEPQETPRSRNLGDGRPRAKFGDPAARSDDPVAGLKKEIQIFFCFFNLIKVIYKCKFYQAVFWPKLFLNANFTKCYLYFKKLNSPKGICIFANTFPKSQTKWA